MLQLQTKRLHFKRYTTEDLPFVLELVTNAQVMKYIGNGLTKTEEYAMQLIERMQEQYQNFDDYGLHVLVHNETNAYVGHAGIVAQIIDDAFELELGYWIHPAYWGQGYGKEAAHALAQYANEELELERYIAAVEVGNVGSEKIAQSVGMTLEKMIQMEGKRVQIYKKENHFQHHDAEL